MGYKYKPSSQVTWEQSPAYNVKVYRKPETIAKEQAMEDFMYWLEYDAEMKSEKQAENLVKFLKPLIAQYLGMDEEKVKAGEQELLEQWIKACGGSGVKINAQGHKFVNAIHDFEHCKACKS